MAREISAGQETEGFSGDSLALELYTTIGSVYLGILGIVEEIVSEVNSFVRVL